MFLLPINLCYYIVPRRSSIDSATTLSWSTWTASRGDSNMLTVAIVLHQPATPSGPPGDRRQYGCFGLTFWTGSDVRDDAE